MAFADSSFGLALLPWATQSRMTASIGDTGRNVIGLCGRQGLGQEPATQRLRQLHQLPGREGPGLSRSRSPSQKQSAFDALSNFDQPF